MDEINYKQSFFLIFTSLFAGLLIENLFFFYEKSGNSINLLIIAAVFGAYLLYLYTINSKTVLHRAVISPPFVVTLLLFYSGAVILGTLIHQEMGISQYYKEFGHFFSKAILFFRINDIFHSYIMVVLNLFLCFSITVYIVKRWKKAHDFDLIITHASLLFIVAGMMAGSVFGKKGMLGLRVGESSRKFVKFNPEKEKPDVFTLPFTVKLLDFSVKRYKSEWRAGILNRESKKFVLFNPEVKKRVTFEGVKVVLKKFFKDFYINTWGSADRSEENVCTEFEVFFHGKKESSFFLFTSPPQFSFIDIVKNKIRLFYFNTYDELAGKLNDVKHIITYKNRQFEVVAGKSYHIENSLFLRVVKIFKNFRYDISGHKAYDDPGSGMNPAIYIELYKEGVKAEEGWLFSNPFFPHKKEGILSGFKYSFHSSLPFLRENYFFVAKTNEFFRLSGGRPVGVSKHEISFGDYVIKVKKTIDRCRFNYGIVPKKGENLSQNSPFFEISVTKKGEKKPRLFRLIYSADSNRIRIDDVYEFFVLKKEGDVKSYESKILIVDDNGNIINSTLKVNSPFCFRGYCLYQADYDKSDPTFSGIMVVYDPALYVVYAGLFLLLSGVVIRLFLGKKKWLKAQT